MISLINIIQNSPVFQNKRKENVSVIHFITHGLLEQFITTRGLPQLKPRNDFHSAAHVTFYFFLYAFL